MKKQEAAPHRAGFCAILGRPNVGKSTLLNRVLGQKLAIVSPKPQTTRNRLLGVHTEENVQLAFFDTPGIHKAKGELNRFMVDQALGALDDVDVALYVIEAAAAKDASSPTGVRVEIGEGERFIVEKLRGSGKPVVLAINKIDAVEKPLLLPIIEAWKDVLPFAAVIPISALEGDGVEQLLQTLAGLVPEGPQLFPPDLLTDAAERVLVAEYVREQLLRHVRQEVPYVAAVIIEEFDESERDDRGLVRIYARIYVERDSQKAIVIGKRGAMLKKIGTDARRTIEKLLGCRVWLGLQVTVEPNWTERADGLRRMGYSS